MGRQDQARQAIICSIAITAVYIAVLWLLLMVAPGSFSKMFMESGEVIAVSKNLIRTYVSGMLFSGMQSTLIQPLIARGMEKQSLFVSALSKYLYVPLLLILPAPVKPAYSVLVIYGAQVIIDIIGVLSTIILASVCKGLQ